MTSPEADRLLRNVLVFTRLLRWGGLRLSPDQTRDFLRALEWVDVTRRDQVFHAGLSLLVSRREDLELFAGLFDRFWHRAPRLGLEARGPRAAPRVETRRLSLAGPAHRPSDASGPELEAADREGSYSGVEVLRRKDFARLTPAELDALREILRQTRWSASLRESRRFVPDPRGGRIHLRRVLREAAKHGGSVTRLARLSRKIKERPLVVLADISGSMERYSRVILQLCYGLSRNLGSVESFVFATRLTRITSQLRIRNVDRALAEAAAEIVDWSGGTRIGECVGAFNRRWGRRVLRRGAVVLIVSDGWERGDVDRLRREMRHLHDRCYRLIWLNPHLGHPEYEPLAEGMAACLRFVDDFLPIHNLDALATLGEVLAGLPRRRRVLRAG